MSRTDNIAVNIPLKDFTCPIMLEIPTEPVSASCCGALFELAAIANVRQCPCCRSEKTLFQAVSPTITNILAHIRSQRSKLEEGVDSPPDVISVELPLNIFTCPTTKVIPFEPVSASCCGQLFEKNASIKITKCPCCKADNITFEPASRIIKNIVESMLQSHPELYKQIYFNVNDFAKLVGQKRITEKKVVDGIDKEIVTQEEGLKTPLGERYMTLLKNNASYLNDSIAILASTRTGRDALRKNLKIQVGQFFFGNSLISAESLQIDVNGKSIQEWLSIPTAVEIIEEEAEKTAALMRAEFTKAFYLKEQEKQSAILAEEQQAFRQLLLSARKQGLFRNTVTAEYTRESCNAVDDILQQVVYGQRAVVRATLENLKNTNPALLKKVLTSVSTKPIYDYSGKKIENLTLLQAAAAANDFTIHPDLANNPAHQGMCDIIQSYFDPTNQAEQTEVLEQYKDVLKRSLQQYIEAQQEEITRLTTLKAAGKTVDDKCIQDAKTRLRRYKTAIDTDDTQIMLDTHKQAQEENTFDFSKIIAAITRAGNAPDQVTAALDKVGASFTEADDATRAKPDDQLTLTESLNRFREQFERYALNKIAVNPHDLIKAFQAYDDQFGLSWDQRFLFARQIIGFVQRYLSAADARIFARGLCDTVNGKCTVPDHFTFENYPSYHFYPNPRLCVGLGFDYLAGVLRAGRRGLWAGLRLALDGSLELQNLCRAKTADIQNLCSNAVCAVARPNTIVAV